jgi:hypothetical protein
MVSINNPTTTNVTKTYGQKGAVSLYIPAFAMPASPQELAAEKSAA